MEIVGELFTTIVDLFKLEVTIFGFTFSWWEVFLFTSIAGILCWFISEVFLGE